MTSVSWGIPGKHQSKDGGRSCENRSSTIFEGYYTNLLNSGDTKEADNPIDNVMCQDIVINVIFGCESELWRLQLELLIDYELLNPFCFGALPSLGLSRVLAQHKFFIYYYLK